MLLPFALFLLALASPPAARAELVPGAVAIDTGDSPSAWSALASPNTTARIEASPGAVGLAFDLGRGRGHAIARRDVSIDLPEDWMLVFVVHGEAEPNTIEIKLVSGENVWWRRLVDWQAPHDASELRLARPRLAFAWGPAGGGAPAHVDAIEIAVVAGKGGRGTLWLDEIRLEPRDAAAALVPAAVATSSNADGRAAMVDERADTQWMPDRRDADPAVTLDFHQPIEQGGLVVDFADPERPRRYVVEASRDGKLWQEQRRFTRARGPRDRIFLPDLFARFVRLRFEPGSPPSVTRLLPQPYEFSSSPNAFFTAIARGEPRGLYPRYFHGEQSYWAVTGTPGGAHEALVNEEGAVEVDAGAFTLEAFVLRDAKLRTWDDDETRLRLRHDENPVPVVERGHVTVTAFAAGGGEDDTLYVRYQVHAEPVTPPRCRQPACAGQIVEEAAAAPREAAAPRARARTRLVVAIRPFQVLPPWQALNRTGGVAGIRRISRDGNTIDVDGRRVVALSAPSAFGAAAFEEGDPVVRLARDGSMPAAAAVEDPSGYASALIAWDLDVSSPAEVWVAVPWTNASRPAPGAEEAARKLREMDATWSALAGRVRIELPPPAEEWPYALRANLAWILVNRDGAAIRPGSRTYERSWIRDGAMTSGALLELGFTGEVKDFLRWYAGYVGDDGFAPCCIDERGADPVPENDSYGEFVWAVAETWRFTRDDAFVRELWPVAKNVADCMGRLRATRLGPAYESGERAAMRGLLPESISHEGYSARPVHSYWDQTFALRGFADAALLARLAGDTEAASRFAAERTAMERDLRASIREVMRLHDMRLVPASVELADFDPTSTANAFLLGLEDIYPREALERSFEKYASEFRRRAGARTRGVGYTAYELRNATALMLLGRKADAIALLAAMTEDQRPRAWRQWPEISWLDPLEPSFLGDLPHTWIGSTYVHAVRSLLVVEREARREGGEGEEGEPVQSLLVGAGIPLDWLSRGDVAAPSLPTWFGPISLSIRSASTRPGERRAQVRVEPAAAKPPGDAASPPAPTPSRTWVLPEGGVVVAAPFGAEVDTVTVDGAPARLEQEGVRLHRLPATVVFQYKP